MYGIIHKKIFESTVMAEGYEVVYVFQCLIILADNDDVVDMGKAALATRINIPLEKLEHALDRLTRPDPESKSTKFDGRRIVPMREFPGANTNRGWFIVNREEYIEEAKKRKRTDYMRNLMREKRAAEKPAEPVDNPPEAGQDDGQDPGQMDTEKGSENGENANNSQKTANKLVNVSVLLAHIDIDIDIYNKNNIDLNRPFDVFWLVYPRKEKKRRAQEIWNRKRIDYNQDLAKLIIQDVIARTLNHSTWKRGFIPHPTTYLNDEAWHDEITRQDRVEAAKQKNEITIPAPDDHKAIEGLGRKLGIPAGKSESYYDYRQRLIRAQQALRR